MPPFGDLGLLARGFYKGSRRDNHRASSVLLFVLFSLALLITMSQYPPVSNLQLHHILILKDMVAADHLTFKVHAGSPDTGGF